MTGFEFGIFYECANPEAATILMVLYMFVVAVIFLNLLIGIMADSWKSVSHTLNQHTLVQCKLQDFCLLLGICFDVGESRFAQSHPFIQCVNVNLNMHQSEHERCLLCTEFTLSLRVGLQLKAWQLCIGLAAHAVVQRACSF